jgi:hypothetical protein
MTGQKSSRGAKVGPVRDDEKGHGHEGHSNF